MGRTTFKADLVRKTVQCPEPMPVLHLIASQQVARSVMFLRVSVAVGPQLASRPSVT